VDGTFSAPVEVTPAEDPDEAIQEVDGVHYISESILDADNSDHEALDPDFRELVNSVIQPDG
jgi:hypothetical protein